MTTKDLLKLSTRMFTARRGRTLLTVLGMGIGFGAILFLVSLGYGLQGALLETITSSGALTALDVTANEQDGKILDPVATSEIKKLDGVEGVETSYNFGARIKLDDAASDVQAEIASPGYFDLAGLKISSGKLLGKNDAKKILVSAAVAKVFGKNAQELIGKKVSYVLFVPAPSLNGEKNRLSRKSAPRILKLQESLRMMMLFSMLLPRASISHKMRLSRR